MIVMLSVGEVRRRNKEIASLGLRFCSGKAGCGRELPFDQFNKRVDGLQYNCRECQKVRDTAKRRANPNHNRDWRQENSVEYLFNNRRYSAKKKCEKYGGTAVKFTLSDLHLDWFARGIDKDACFLCCEAFLPGEGRTEEHDIPLSRGGDDAPHNLSPAHHSCNAEKGGKTLAEYRVWVAEGNRITCRNKKLQKKLDAHAVRARKMGKPADKIKARALLDWWDFIDADRERCSYCRVNKADQIDHIIELEKPDGAHRMELLLPVCGACNQAKKVFDSMEAYLDSLAQVGRWMPVEAILSGTWNYCELAAAEEADRIAGVAAGRKKNKTECLRGHLLEGNNVPKSAADKGQRSCRACMNAGAWFHKRGITPTAAELQAKADEFYAKFMPQESVWKETENDDE